MNACGMLLAAVVACAMLQPAHAAVKDQSPNGFTLENSQWVPVDQATAWKVFVHDVGKWWPSGHTWWGDASRLSISEQAGGCFCELNGAQQAWHMSVTFVDPGKLMRMTGGLGPLQGMGEQHGALEWCFAEENGGTRITLRYGTDDYLPDDISELAVAVEEVQSDRLQGLARYLRAPSEA